MEQRFLNSCKDGNLKRVTYTIDKGVNIHIHNDLALRWAAKYNNKDIVNLLLNNNANIHAKGDDALIKACQKGNSDIVKILVDKGSKTPDALVAASKNNHYSIVKYLFDKGGNFRANLNKAYIEAIKENNLEIAEFLIKHGANNEALTKNDIIYACLNYSTETLKFSITMGLPFDETVQDYINTCITTKLNAEVQVAPDEEATQTIVDADNCSNNDFEENENGVSLPVDPITFVTIPSDLLVTVLESQNTRCFNAYTLWNHWVGQLSAEGGVVNQYASNPFNRAYFTAESVVEVKNRIMDSNNQQRDQIDKKLTDDEEEALELKEKQEKVKTFQEEKYLTYPGQRTNLNILQRENPLPPQVQNEPEEDVQSEPEEDVQRIDIYQRYDIRHELGDNFYIITSPPILEGGIVQKTEDETFIVYGYLTNPDQTISENVLESNRTFKSYTSRAQLEAIERYGFMILGRFDLLQIYDRRRGRRVIRDEEYSESEEEEIESPRLSSRNLQIESERPVPRRPVPVLPTPREQSEQEEVVLNVNIKVNSRSRNQNVSLILKNNPSFRQKLGDNFYYCETTPFKSAIFSIDNDIIYIYGYYRGTTANTIVSEQFVRRVYPMSTPFILQQIEKANFVLKNPEDLERIYEERNS